MVVRDPSLLFSSIIDTPGPFTDPEYDPVDARTSLCESNILIIGAGGLGCEMLKDLALSGFPKLSVIDMDTIELSNLNRQFLFRQKDVGEPKAIVAARAVQSRISTCQITPYFNKIQDFDDEFYKQFTMIISGLDSIEARGWINSILVNIAENGVLIPFIDGGTEGFHGSVKVMIPTYTACFECYMPLVPDKISYPLCTLASTPRLAEHCIEWAHQFEWSKTYPEIEFDADNLQHIEQMYQLALIRAQSYGIEGVTKAKTLGVVKNIIPAIASTNAIISAQCCNEAFKFITDVNPVMKDMMFYNGEVGIVAVNNEYQRQPNCAVCGSIQKTIELNKGLETTVEEVANLVKMNFALESPSLVYNGKDIYNFKMTESNAKMSQRNINDIVKFNEIESKMISNVILVLDRKLSNTMKLTLEFSK